MMTRLLKLLPFLLFLCGMASAQTVVLTANSGVVSSNNILYAQGTYSVALVSSAGQDLSTSPVMIGGIPVTIPSQQGKLSATATFNITLLTANSGISSPTGTQYRIGICSINPVTQPSNVPLPPQVCFTYTATFNSNTDLSATLSALAPPIQVPNGCPFSSPGSCTVTGNFSIGGTLAAPIINNVTWVDGVVFPRTNAGIQSAVNISPAGGTIGLGPGTYVLTATTGQQILINGSGATNFLCQGWGANLSDQSASAIPLIRYAPSGISGYVDYGARIDNCSLTAATPGNGSWAIQIDIATTGSVKNMVLNHTFIGCPINGAFQCTTQAFGSGAIFVNNASGTGGMLSSYLHQNTIYGSVNLTRMGDAVNIIENDLWDSTINDFIYADFVAGSTSFRMKDNSVRIPLHLGTATYTGGVMSAAAQFCLIDSNEWEPRISTLAGSNGAMVDLDGSSGSNVLKCHVSNNTFQMTATSPNVSLDAIRLNYATQTDIGGFDGPNDFIIATGQVGVRTVSGHTTGTRLNHNTYGTTTSWSTILSDGAGNAQITQDANLNGTLGSTPLLSQASGGGAILQGFYGPAFSAVNGANEFGDGNSSSNIALVLSDSQSSVPVSGTITSSWESYMKQLCINTISCLTANNGNGLYLQHSDGTGVSVPATFDSSGNLTAAAINTATLTSGVSATISTPKACTPSSTCVYEFTNCGINASTAIGVYGATNISVGTSFKITAFTSAAATATGDASTVCWRIN